MLGSILGAVGSIAGGLLGNKAAKKQAQRDYQNQKEFAQNTIQWKAQDAEKAGISKVYAMGAPTASFSPSSVGSNFNFLESAGQNIGRAIQSGQSPAGKATGFDRAAQTVQLEGMQLDNDLKRTQIASLQKTWAQPGTPPGAPDRPYAIPGQPISIDAPTLKQETKLDVGAPGEPALVPGSTPEVLLTDTVSGGRSFVPPPAMQEALESMGKFGTFQYMMRNGLLPLVFDSYRPAQFRSGASSGYAYTYNPLTGEYHRVKSPRRYGGGKHGG